MNYTLFVGKATTTTSPFVITKNCANQSIAFDGPAKRKQAVEMAKHAAKHFEWVQVFAGKTLGKLVLELPEVCSVCREPWDTHP